MHPRRAASETMRLPLGPRATSRAASAWGAVAGALVFCALVAAVGPWGGVLRAAGAAALVALAAVVHQTLGLRRRPPHGWLVADDAGLHRVDAMRAAQLVEWDQPFGVSIFASPNRQKLVFAFTTPRAMRFLTVRLRSEQDAQSAATVVERAMTAAESDVAVGDESELAPADGEQLMSELLRRAPSALDRVFLSDATGDAVVLDRSELRVGARRIDLTAPLEWRAFLFQERGVQAASVCQATWVRQADAELVLVAPMPADGVWFREVQDGERRPKLIESNASVRASVARDLRLMQATAGEPPARELRRAIDRVFMLPLRRALDRAPRVTRGPAPRPSRPEGRA
jgi:hypothetical protein